jgi:hypothetical protein
MTAVDLSSDATQDLTFMQRVMVQHAHPLKLCCDGTGVVVGLHLVWRHRLPAAVTVLLGSSILGSLLVRGAETRRLAATWLGRWMLGQARPVNLVVRTAGFVVLLTGVWRHSTGLIVGGAAAIVAARPLSSRSLRPRAQRPPAQRRSGGSAHRVRTGSACGTCRASGERRWRCQSEPSRTRR